MADLVTRISPASNRPIRSGSPRRRRPTRPTTSCAPSRPAGAAWSGRRWARTRRSSTRRRAMARSPTTATRVAGFNNIELITDRPLAGQSARDQGGEARLARPRAHRLADGAVRGGELEAHPGPRRRDRRRRRRAQFRLPARHVRARHGRRRRPGARLCRDGDALVQAAHADAGDRQADPQRHQHPRTGARRGARRRRRGEPDQHAQLDHRRRSRPDGADAGGRRQGDPWRLLRPGGEADRAAHGGRDRPRSRMPQHPDRRHRRHRELARRGRVHGARRRRGPGLHRGDALRLPHRRRHDRRARPLDGRQGPCSPRRFRGQSGAQRHRLAVPQPQLPDRRAHRSGSLHQMRPLPHRLRGHGASGDRRHAQRRRSGATRSSTRNASAAISASMCVRSRIALPWCGPTAASGISTGRSIPTIPCARRRNRSGRRARRSRTSGSTSSACGRA